MNPNSTAKVPESTNNLSANIVQTGSVSFVVGEFTNTGGLITNGTRAAYYATKSVTSNIDSNTIPFVFAWYNLGQSATNYVGMNAILDFENPYAENARAWFTMDKPSSKIRINFYIVDELANVTNGVTVYYRIVSANATEVSGL